MELSVTVVTDPAQKDGPLMRLSKAYDWEVFPVPYGIGGRFSVLSTPGLIVAATLGMNLSQLLAGAANMDEVCRGSDWRRNPALFGAAVKYLAARDHGASIEVFMPYAMRLKRSGNGMSSCLLNPWASVRIGMARPSFMAGRPLLLSVRRICMPRPSFTRMESGIKWFSSFLLIA